MNNLNRGGKSKIKAVIADCLARGSGKRLATLDVIGAGPRAIAGVLELHSINYDLYTGEYILKNSSILGEYDLLLASAMTSDYGCVKRVIKAWNKYSKNLSILGGPITSDIMSIKDLGFDIGVIGEGEHVLSKILQLLPKDDFEDLILKVRGIVTIRNGKLIFTGVSENLDRALLCKYKSSIKAVTYYPNYWASRVYVEVVRGCSNFYRPIVELPGGKKCIDCKICFDGKLESRGKCPVDIPPGCGYCSVPVLYGHSRSKDVEYIVKEVEGLINIGVRRIVLSAPDFLDYGRDLLVSPKPLTDPRSPPPNLERIELLLQEITSISEINSGEVSVMIENIKPNLVNKQVAKLLGKYLKGTTVHIGVETGDDHHSKMLGRPNTISEAINAVKILKRYGIKPYVYFIHGLPGQNGLTVENTLKTMDEMYRVGAEKITVYRFRPLPMTAFAKFQAPPPAVKDKLSLLIYEKAKKINLLSKYRLKGVRVKAIVVSEYPKNKNYLVAYPMTHGPVILIPKRRGIIRSIVEVKVENVYSDRTVKGRVLKVIKKIGE